MFKYALESPVDCFCGCKLLSEYMIDELKMREKWGRGAEDKHYFVSDLITKLITELKELSAWEGDIREGIYVFAFPPEDNCSMEVGFIFKQDNNGDTFVLSPFELPWLAKYKV